jgi:DNA-binding transcriptional regulator GbsR (MarR family)
MAKTREERMAEFDSMELEDLYTRIIELEDQLESAKTNKGRKSEVLDLLRNNETMTIVEMAERLGISAKNVSSQLTYLRQEGFNICTNAQGRKFIVEDK